MISSMRNIKEIAKGMDMNMVTNQVKEIKKHLEDISEAQDELTMAVISIYNNQKAIAKSLEVKLPLPLIDMTVEKGVIDSEKTKEKDNLIEGGKGK